MPGCARATSSTHWRDAVKFARVCEDWMCEANARRARLVDDGGLMAEEAAAGKAVSRASSLRCDQLFWRDLVHLHAGGFRSPAHVPGAEQELLHGEGVRDCGEIVPRLDEGIAEHGALHQPEAEGQNQLAAQPGRKLAVHDDDASARTQLLPCVVQYREVVRHGIVAKAEQDAVERLTGDVFDGVALGQLDVRPLLAPAQRPRAAQHAGREIDAVDSALAPDRLAQKGKIATGATSD